MRAHRCNRCNRCTLAARSPPARGISLTRPPPSPPTTTTTTTTFKQAGAVIGKGGELIKKIESSTRAKIAFEQAPRGYEERVIHVSSDE